MDRPVSEQTSAQEDQALEVPPDTRPARTRDKKPKEGEQMDIVAPIIQAR
jgi:hypothetical protein